MPTGTRYELNGTECPTCGRDDFSSTQGVRQHHATQHGESLPNLICEFCGNLFYYKTRRAKCDECIQQVKQEREQRYKEKPFECDECDDRFDSEKGKKIHHYYKHGESIADWPQHPTVVTDSCQNEEWRESCPNCGEEHINMGHHWNSNRCHFPELSPYQKDLLRGLLMSDASIQKGVHNNLTVQMTSFVSKDL